MFLNNTHENEYRNNLKKCRSPSVQKRCIQFTKFDPFFCYLLCSIKLLLNISLTPCSTYQYTYKYRSRFLLLHYTFATLPQNHNIVYSLGDNITSTLHNEQSYSKRRKGINLPWKVIYWYLAMKCLVTNKFRRLPFIFTKSRIRKTFYTYGLLFIFTSYAIPNSTKCIDFLQKLICSFNNKRKTIFK